MFINASMLQTLRHKHCGVQAVIGFFDSRQNKEMRR